MYKERVKLYDKLVSECSGFERKGKTMPYTSANGYMFSQINKNGELGIRFSKEIQEKYFQELNTTTFMSYGKVMEGYVLMPEKLWDDLDTLAIYLKESFDYVMSLTPK